MDDLLLTEKADLRCTHLHSGVITVPASQDWVTIKGVPIPVEPDPVGRPVDKCQVPMNSNCKVTAGVTGGYSGLLRIDGHKVCLKSLVGPTIALPPGTFEVLDAGQDFVEEVK